MPSAPTIPDPENPAEQAVPRTQYYLSVLDELVAMGTDIARKTHQQIIAPAPEPAAGAARPTPDPAPNLIGVFDRIARTICHAIALARKLAEPVKPSRAADPARDGIRDGALDRARARQDAARQRIIREVEDARERGILAATISDEILERINDLDIDEHNDRPTAEIIADICLALGLKTPFGTNRKRRPAAARAKTPAASIPFGKNRHASRPLETTGSDPP
jgi:hypothetical protein